MTVSVLYVNTAAQRQNCPIIREEELDAFLQGILPEPASYLPVPSGVSTSAMAFWIEPSTSQHFVARRFLVLTNTPGLDVNDAQEPFAHCYRHIPSNAIWLGCVNSDDAPLLTGGEAAQILPLMPSVANTPPFEEMEWVGVVACGI